MRLSGELEEEKSRVVKAHDGTVQDLREQLASERREVRMSECIVEQDKGCLCVCVCIGCVCVHIHCVYGHCTVCTFIYGCSLKLVCERIMNNTSRS